MGTKQQIQKVVDTLNQYDIVSKLYGSGFITLHGRKGNEGIEVHIETVDNSVRVDTYLLGPYKAISSEKELFNRATFKGFKDIIEDKYFPTY